MVSSDGILFELSNGVQVSVYRKEVNDEDNFWQLTQIFAPSRNPMYFHTEDSAWLFLENYQLPATNSSKMLHFEMKEMIFSK